MEKRVNVVHLVNKGCLVLQVPLVKAQVLMLQLWQHSWDRVTPKVLIL